MKINIRGKNIEITDSINTHILEKMSKLDKYFSGDVSANIVCKVNGINQTVEVTITSNGLMIRAEVSTKSLYESIDIVIDKLEGQIRKNKSRLKKLTKIKQPIFNLDFDEIEEEKMVVKTKRIETKPMDIEEAILQLELIGHDFYVYKDSETNETSILYKRKDGNYGVIETK